MQREEPFIKQDALQSFPSSIPYRIADTPWREDGLGNHRVVLLAEEMAPLVRAVVPWRRRDRHPEDKRLILLARSGEKAASLLRLRVTQEEGEFLFEPVAGPGIYDLYYLPFVPCTTKGRYDGEYLLPEEPPTDDLFQHDVAPSDLPLAKVLTFEARTAIDSFFPMEVPATSIETDSFLRRHYGTWFVFAESRRRPVRMFDQLPWIWLDRVPGAPFSGTACRNEYYIFQLVVYAAQESPGRVWPVFSAFSGPCEEIPASCFTCFQTLGRNVDGVFFEKDCHVSRKTVQPFWIGVNLPANLPIGRYTGSVGLHTEHCGSKTIDVTINVTARFLSDRGDSEAWRHSRLRWLNSDRGMRGKVIPPFSPLQRDGRRINFLNGSLRVTWNGLPEAIEKNTRQILTFPVSFEVVGVEGVETIIDKVSFQDGANEISWRAATGNAALFLEVRGRMEFDGHLFCSCVLTCRRQTDIEDCRLVIIFPDEIARYCIGMGLAGGPLPDNYKTAWKTPWNSFWVGSHEAGLHCKLYGSSYNGPLLTIYRPGPPPAWYNNGQGSVGIETMPNGDKSVVVSSGRRRLREGSEVLFSFSLQVTPAKSLDTSRQFRERYYHNSRNPAPEQEDLAAGVNIIVIHHATPQYPHINFPFVDAHRLKAFVDTWHQRGVRVKLYYTDREMSCFMDELWALRSLGGEIFTSGPGGGHPWLREHLIDGYQPGWYVPAGSKKLDFAIRTTPCSRLANYYVEGVDWLARHTGIDGLYIDDAAFDRRIMKRVRRVMHESRPIVAIDLHSNTGMSRGPANQYAEFFPYIDKLFFGEEFDYEKMSPEAWLVEVSGIPFGIMGDMLQSGGNPWRGMLFGMTSRRPFRGGGDPADPRPLWRLWDDFHISAAEMVGFWQEACPVQSGHAKARAIAYVRPGSTLLVFASWSKESVELVPVIEWSALGLHQETALAYTPEIDGLQSYQVMRTQHICFTLPPYGGRIVRIDAGGP